MKFIISRPENIRSFTFGVEDSLVSTAGLISGIAVAGISKSTILLTGIVLIFVEAFSMAVGTLLSDNSAREFEKHSDVSFKNSAISSLIMFFSYLLSGFIVLFPYIYFERNLAIVLSIVFSAATLFILGLINAYFSRTSFLKKGLIMVSMGGLAILIGVMVSNLVNKL